jgi:hypothetical protein
MNILYKSETIDRNTNKKEWVECYERTCEICIHLDEDTLGQLNDALESAIGKIETSDALAILSEFKINIG